MSISALCDSVEDGVRQAKEHGCKAVWISIPYGCRYLHWVDGYFVKRGEAPPKDMPYFYELIPFSGKLLHREIF